MIKSGAVVGAQSREESLEEIGFTNVRAWKNVQTELVTFRLRSRMATAGATYEGATGDIVRTLTTWEANPPPVDDLRIALNVVRDRYLEADRVLEEIGDIPANIEIGQVLLQYQISALEGEKAATCLDIPRDDQNN